MNWFFNNRGIVHHDWKAKWQNVKKLRKDPTWRQTPSDSRKKWQPNVQITPLQRTNLFFTSLNYKNINVAGGTDRHGQRFHVSTVELEQEGK